MSDSSRDTATRARARQWRLPAALRGDVAMSRDGQLLVTASTEGAVHLWNFVDGSLRCTLAQQGKQFDRFEVSPDRNLLLAYQKGGEIGWGIRVLGTEAIHEFNVANCKLVATLTGRDSKANAVSASFLGSGMRVVAGFDDGSG